MPADEREPVIFVHKHMLTLPQAPRDPGPRRPSTRQRGAPITSNGGSQKSIAMLWIVEAAQILVLGNEGTMISGAPFDVWAV